MATLMAVVILLHGLAHLWYVTLSLRWVAFRPEMGWSGESWLLSSLFADDVVRILATILYTIAALGFIASGVGMLAAKQWFRAVMLWSAAISLIAIVLFWDGGTSQLVEKGLLGLVINVLAIIGVLVANWL